MPIDVWMQHPTVRFLSQDMCESLWRWTSGGALREELPIEATVEAMDAANVEVGILAAWHAPRDGALISNDEVAGWVAQHPDRVFGL